MIIKKVTTQTIIVELKQKKKIITYINDGTGWIHIRPSKSMLPIWGDRTLVDDAPVCGLLVGVVVEGCDGLGVKWIFGFSLEETLGLGVVVWWTLVGVGVVVW